jgi:putative ABC transport system permease protein
MNKGLNIFWSSLKLTIQELRVNKLRTILSLVGVAFGIFCIIGVLATVNSLETNIKNEVNSLGSNTIYIDKWDYSGGPDNPWWKYRARPEIKFAEMAMLKERSQLTEEVTFLMQTGSNLSYDGDMLSNISVYGITEAQMAIQPLKFDAGRFFSTAEFSSATNVGLIGYSNAEKLFGNPQRAVGKQVTVKGKKITIIGVIKKEGKNFISWDYDNCIMLCYRFCKQIFEEKSSNPILIVKGRENTSTYALDQELKGVMRQIRRLGPKEEDNFTLNSVEAFSKSVSTLFGTLNIVFGFIGGISLIVGLFGIANIMFVTVKERTSIIGLKKAIGAKSSSILQEFLVEATIMCLVGGFMGLILVWLTTKALTAATSFEFSISVPLLITAIIICVVVGILAGIIPARQASKLDPVKAIRS